MTRLHNFGGIRKRMEYWWCDTDSGKPVQMPLYVTALDRL